MSAITRWDPFKELDELQDRLATLFGRAPVRKYGDKEEAMTVAAEFKDGVLKVRLSKTEKAKPKSVEVKVG